MDLSRSGCWPVPLGGFAGWADLGLEARPRAKAGALAAENGGASLPPRLRVVTCQGGAEAAAALEAGSWRWSMFCGLEPGSTRCPDTWSLRVGWEQTSVIAVDQ